MPGKIGYVGYIRALAALPATTAELAAASGFEQRSTASLMRSLWSLKMVHPGGTAGTKQHPRVVWHAGDGPNLTRAKCGPQLRPYIQHITMAYALRALADGATTEEVQDAIGQSRETAQRIVRMLRHHGLLRICEWRRGTDHKPVAVYEYCRGKDAPKPIQTPSEKNRRYRERQRCRVIELRPIVLRMAA